MPVRRARTDPGEGRAASAIVKPAGPLSAISAQRRLDQRLAQIAVMIAAALVAAGTGPAHVKDFYIGRRRNPA